MSDGIFNGPGKYDAECTRVRDATNADGVILIVIGGTLGQGFSVQAPLEVIARLPETLRDVANQIERQLRKATS